MTGIKRVTIEISVVVTNYNYGRYLGRCLRSLLSQDTENSKYEIILVDDGSTDDSREVAEIFSENIQIIKNEVNLGLATTANIGLSKARGRYVVRVDSDDYVHKSFLNQIMIGFELMGSEFQAIAVDYYKVDEIGKILSYGNSNVEPIACGIGFKIDALESIGFYNSKLRINEEIDLRKRFIAEGFEILRIPLPLYRYVQHSKSLTKSVLI